MTILTTRQPDSFFLTQMFGSGIFRTGKELLNKNPAPATNKILEKLLANARVGLWTIDLESKKINLCETAKSLFDLACNDEPGINNLLRAVRADYRKPILSLLKHVCQENEMAEMEIQVMITGENSCRWLKITADLCRDHASFPSRLLIGSLIDITAQKEEQMRKDDCMAMLSHELRSPLTTIKLYVQMVINNVKTVKDLNIADLLAKADTQATAMNRLIDNFLAMSVLKNGKMQLFPEPFDMISLMHGVTSEMQLKFPEHRFIIEFSGSTKVLADKEKITQVLINYISNAVKYSAENSLVTIRCLKTCNEIEVSVQDEGTGISPDDQSKIFDRFYRTKTSGASGFGIGLYIVKAIIQAHDGNVWVKSSLGDGSLFGFSIPSVL